MKIIPMSILLIFLTTKVVYAETVELVSFKKGTYTGEMVNGQPNGDGHYVDDEVDLSGNFCNGLLHGKGVMIILRTGTRYEGTFTHGTLNGQGICQSKNDKYVGNFVDTRFDGYGVVFFNNGGCYKGFFKDGLYNGYGEFYMVGIGTHKGQYVDGYRNGYGEMYWENGDIYKGTYVNDVRTGSGVIVSHTGWKYDGGFVDNKFDGQGIFIEPQGARAVGMFKNGKLNGYATRYDEKGNIVEQGYWNNGDYIGTTPDGK